MVPQQNRRMGKRFTSFTDSVTNHRPMSKQSASIFNYRGRNRGTQGESVNSGSNPTYITVRRTGGAVK